MSKIVDWRKLSLTAIPCPRCGLLMSMDNSHLLCTNPDCQKEAAENKRREERKERGKD